MRIITNIIYIRNYASPDITVLSRNGNNNDYKISLNQINNSSGNNPGFQNQVLIFF